MIYLIDTNVCVRYLRAPLSQVAQKLADTPPAEIALSTITVAELTRGAYRSTQVSYNLAQVNQMLGQFTCLALDQTAAIHAGRIDAELIARPTYWCLRYVDRGDCASTRSDIGHAQYRRVQSCY